MNTVVAVALKQRGLMVALLLFIFSAGIISFAKLNIEAYPDPVPPVVGIVTQNPGQSAEEIERYITIPIEIPDGRDPARHCDTDNFAVRFVGRQGAVHL